MGSSRKRDGTVDNGPGWMPTDTQPKRCKSEYSPWAQNPSTYLFHRRPPLSVFLPKPKERERERERERKPTTVAAVTPFPPGDLKGAPMIYEVESHRGVLHRGRVSLAR